MSNTSITLMSRSIKGGPLDQVGKLIQEGDIILFIESGKILQGEVRTLKVGKAGASAMAKAWRVGVLPDGGDRIKSIPLPNSVIIIKERVMDVQPNRW